MRPQPVCRCRRPVLGAAWWRWLGLGLALWASLGARADTWGVHLGSHHYPNNSYNNSNPGLYWISDEGWAAGAFYNSYERATLYGGKLVPLAGPVSFFLAAATGYPAADVVPLAGLSWRLPALGGVFPRLLLIPALEFNGRRYDGVLHLSLEKPF